MNLEFPKGKKVVLFDGVCNLCNNFINLIIDKDKNNVFVFASLQSDVGKEIMEHLHIDSSKLDSVILYDPDVAYYFKSEAALHIVKEFSGPWKLLQVFRILPTRFNDLIYDFVGRNRYKWFGKSEQCRIPTPELKAKFLG